MTTYEADIAVIGGGLGGCAAALAACQAGRSVVLTEPTDWIGGQATSQGVSALDEHEHIEHFGGTRSYMTWREAIRQHYREAYGVARMPNGDPLNPGDGWVSKLCFEPHVGSAALQDMLAPHVASGRLTILLGHEPASAQVVDDRVFYVGTCQLPLPLGERAGVKEETLRIKASYFLDATELGDLLPLTGTEHITGAESRADTGELDAPDETHPDEIQGFTYCFAVEYCPGESHVIEKPRGYEHLRDAQPYTLVLRHKDGSPRPFKMFAPGEVGLPFWTYRRLLSRELLDPQGARGLHDIALINWNSNDYHWRSLIGASAERAAERAGIEDEAKRLSLGFLYWLQTECPRDEGGFGYPEFKLRPDVMGTTDGLGRGPYIRESRRIQALTRIVAQDILAALRHDAKQAAWPDSVGVGWYPMDLHPAVGNLKSMFEPTLPFQIPLGALIPVRAQNLIAACKNIGTTHRTNGAYRLHPVEWNIGESAGALAAICCEMGKTPREVRDDATLLKRFQDRLRERGVPLDWSAVIG